MKGKPVIKLLFFPLLLLALSGETIYSGNGIKWKAFDRGAGISARTRKPMLIYFYSQYCGYCRKMDQESFGNRDIIKNLNANYVPVRVNVDNTARNIKYKKKMITPREFFFLFNGAGLPYMVFLDSEKRVITSIPGYIQRAVFHPLLEYIKNSCYEKKVTFEDYVADRSLCREK